MEIEGRAQMEGKLRTQLKSMEENMSSSQSELESKLTAKIKELNQQNETYLLDIKSGKNQTMELTASLEA